MKTNPFFKKHSFKGNNSFLIVIGGIHITTRGGGGDSRKTML